MTAAQAKIGRLEGAAAPIPCEGLAVDLRTSAVLTAAWVATEAVSVQQARKVTLLIAYSADSSGAANRCQITLWGSCEDGASANTAPAITDDKWYAPGIIDVSPTDAVLTGTPVTSFVATVQPEYRNFAVGPLSLTTIASDAGTDKIRLAVPVDVSAFRWFHIQCKELGDTDAGDLGVLGVKYVLHL
jgi:hypothetical protein